MAVLMVVVDVAAVQADDGQSEDELQEAHARDEHAHHLGALAYGLGGVCWALDVGAGSDVGGVVGHLDGWFGAVVGLVAWLLELFGLFCLLLGGVVLFGFGEAEFDQWDDEEGHFGW